MTDIPNKGEQAVKNRERDMYKKGIDGEEEHRHRQETQVSIREARRRNELLNMRSRRQPTRPTTGKRGFGDMESSEERQNMELSPTKRSKNSGKETEIRECIDLRLKQMEATRSASSSPSAPFTLSDGPLNFDFGSKGGKRKSRKRKTRKRKTRKRKTRKRKPRKRKTRKRKPRKRNKRVKRRKKTRKRRR